MQIHGIWEVRATGDDYNSGGFFPNVADENSVDYSQQDAAQLTLTDLTLVTGANVFPAQLQSATGGFTAAMLGNTIAVAGISSGTFVITGIIDSNNIWVENTLWIQGINWSGTKNAKIGGAKYHLGNTIGSMGSPGPAGGGVLALPGGDDIVWVKSGTYDTYYTSLGGGIYFGKSAIIGYTTTRGDGAPTRPVLRAASDSFAGGDPLIEANVGRFVNIENIVFDANGIYYAAVESGSYEGVVFRNCRFTGGAVMGGLCSLGTFIDCEYVDNGAASGTPWTGDPGDFDFQTAGCVTYGDFAQFVKCRFSDNVGPGFYSDGGAYVLDRCVSDHNQGPGLYHDWMPDANCALINCAFDGNGYDGLVGAPGSGTPPDNVLDMHSFRNCVFSNNGGYGINSLDKDYTADTPEVWADRITRCAFYNNASGDEFQVPPAADKIILTADPWTDAASGDYSTNDAAGGGALLRGAGLPVNVDVGPEQHECPEAGEGVILPPPGPPGTRALQFGFTTFDHSWKVVHDPQRRVLGYAKSPRRDGARVSVGTLEGKKLHVRGGVIQGPLDNSEWRPRLDSLRAALAQGPQDFYLWTDRFYRLMQGEELPEEYGDTGWGRISEINLVFTGPEPFMCETTLNEEVWAAPSGTLAIDVGGNAPAPPVLSFRVGGTGAESIDFTLADNTTGESFQLAGDVEAGDIIIVDCQPYVSVQIAGVDRMDLFRGEFLRFKEATSNTLAITVADGTLAELAIEWRNRWR